MIRLRHWSWNGYPSHIHNLLIKRLKTNKQRSEANKEEQNRKIIWLKFPYLGKKCKTLLKSLEQKLSRCLKEDAKFIASYKMKKMTIFYSVMKKWNNSWYPSVNDIIHDIKSPACQRHYARKTDQFFVTRLDRCVVTRQYDQPICSNT